MCLHLLFGGGFMGFFVGGGGGSGISELIIVISREIDCSNNLFHLLFHLLTEIHVHTQPKS